jgi:hypothetical protein
MAAGACPKWGALLLRFVFVRREPVSRGNEDISFPFPTDASRSSWHGEREVDHPGICTTDNGRPVPDIHFWRVDWEAKRVGSG